MGLDSHFYKIDKQDITLEEARDLEYKAEFNVKTNKYKGEGIESIGYLRKVHELWKEFQFEDNICFVTEIELRRLLIRILAEGEVDSIWGLASTAYQISAILIEMEENDEEEGAPQKYFLSMSW